MTNSSPQDPQNPIPERRKRSAAGVTFDEMIAIIVAFSTIGAILFWSWGGKKGGIASNFGLGRQNSSLSGTSVGLGLSGINADSDMSFGKLESDRDSFKRRDRQLSDRSSVDLASDSRKFAVASRIKSESYELDPTSPLASLGVGTAALPALNNRANTNQGFNSGNIVTGNSNQTNVPDSVTTPGKTDSQAIPPENIEMPDDVVPSYWAYPFVKQMSDQALVADFTEDQDFEPDKLITRAAMATLISQAFDNKPENETIKKFKDVSNQNAIAADVDQAVRMGFMQGYSDDEFRPLENIPRYQVLVTLATGLGLTPSQDAAQILQKFGDGSNLPDWAKQQVAAAVESGLVVNRPNVASNSLSPNEPATRAEVAAMIHQALVKTGKLEPLESEYILEP